MLSTKLQHLIVPHVTIPVVLKNAAAVTLKKLMAKKLSIKKQCMTIVSVVTKR